MPRFGSSETSRTVHSRWDSLPRLPFSADSQILMSALTKKIKSDKLWFYPIKIRRFLMVFQRNNRNLIIILIIAFILRIGLYFLALSIHQSLLVFHAGDTSSYLQPALSLFKTGQFLDFDGEPNIFRTPGYSLFLLPGLMANQVESVTIVLQILLSVLTVYFVYQIGSICFNKKVATLAAFLYAIEPLSVLYPTLLLSETLFAALYTLLIYLLLKAIESRDQLIKILPLAGLCLSAAILVRPIAYYLIVLIPILIFFVSVKTGRYKIKIAVVSLLIFLVCLTPVYLWKMRNQMTTGYEGISTVTETNLYYWHAGAIVTAKEKLHFDQVLNKFTQKLHSEIPIKQVEDKYRLYPYMREQGIQTIKDNPLTYLTIRLNGTIALLVDLSPWLWIKLLDIQIEPSLFPDSLTIFYQRGYLGLLDAYLNEMPRNVYRVWILLQLIAIPCLVLAIVGLAVIFYDRLFMKPEIWIVLSLTAYIIAIAGGPEGFSSRYRHPIMPVYCWLAGYALNYLFDRYQTFNAGIKR